MPQELRRLPFKLKGELQMKNAVSRFGKSLSGMVMPNIGMAIREIPTRLKSDILVCAVEREGGVIIPNGNSTISAQAILR